jgi:hypothetical protein
MFFMVMRNWSIGAEAPPVQTTGFRWVGPFEHGAFLLTRQPKPRQSGAMPRKLRIQYPGAMNHPP